MRLNVFLFLFLLGAIPLFGSDKAQNAIRHYQQTVNNKTNVSTCQRLLDTSGIVIKTENGPVSEHVVVSKNGATIAWYYEDTKSCRSISAYRVADQIVVSATIHEVSEQRRYPVRQILWKQDLTDAVERFGKSPDTYFEFYYIRPEDFSMERMFFKKEALEPIDVMGMTQPALRIRFSLTGFRSSFWSAFFYTHPKEGYVLKYIGDHGPGTEKFTSELMR